jgi:hypothetical protein
MDGLRLYGDAAFKHWSARLILAPFGMLGSNFGDRS